MNKSYYSVVTMTEMNSAIRTQSTMNLDLIVCAEEW